MKTNNLLKNYRNKNLSFIRLLLILIAFILMICSQLLIKQYSAEWYIIAFSIASSVLATVIVSIVTKLFDGNNIEEEIIERFEVLRIYQQYNLERIQDTFPLDEKYKQDFIKSKRVVVVMNDAKAFVSNNHPLFDERLKQKNSETIFIIEDYNQNDIIAALERKNGHESGYYKKKIYDVIGYDLMHLYDDAKQNNHHLKLFLNHNINTLGIILTDTYAMESIYRVSAGKTTVPHFVFTADGKEYGEVSRDVENLISGKENCTGLVNFEEFRQEYKASNG